MQPWSAQPRSQRAAGPDAPQIEDATRQARLVEECFHAPLPGRRQRQGDRRTRYKLALRDAFGPHLAMMRCKPQHDHLFAVSLSQVHAETLSRRRRAPCRRGHCAPKAPPSGRGTSPRAATAHSPPWRVRARPQGYRHTSWGLQQGPCGVPGIAIFLRRRDPQQQFAPGMDQRERLRRPCPATASFPSRAVAAPRRAFQALLVRHRAARRASRSALSRRAKRAVTCLIATSTDCMSKPAKESSELSPRVRL